MHLHPRYFRTLTETKLPKESPASLQVECPPGPAECWSLDEATVDEFPGGIYINPP